MIAALVQTTNKFVHGETSFGWEPIEGMLVREAQRKMNFHACQVYGKAMCIEMHGLA